MKQDFYTWLFFRIKEKILNQNSLKTAEEAFDESLIVESISQIKGILFQGETPEFDDIKTSTLQTTNRKKDSKDSKKVYLLSKEGSSLLAEVDDSQVKINSIGNPDEKSFGSALLLLNKIDTNEICLVISKPTKEGVRFYKFDILRSNIAIARLQIYSSEDIRYIQNQKPDITVDELLNISMEKETEFQRIRKIAHTPISPSLTIETTVMDDKLGKNLKNINTKITPGFLTEPNIFGEGINSSDKKELCPDEKNFIIAIEELKEATKQHSK